MHIFQPGCDKSPLEKSFFNNQDKGLEETIVSTECEQTKCEEDRLFRRLTRVEIHLKNEFDLIGQRVNWLLASNAFLFTALMLNVNHVNSATAPYSRLISHAALLLSTLGIGSSLLTLLSIIGAYQVVNKLKFERQNIEREANRKYQHDQIGVNNHDIPHILGHLAPLFLPLLLILVWVLMAIFRYF